MKNAYDYKIDAEKFRLKYYINKEKTITTFIDSLQKTYDKIKIAPSYFNDNFNDDNNFPETLLPIIKYLKEKKLNYETKIEEIDERMTLLKKKRHKKPKLEFI